MRYRLLGPTGLRVSDLFLGGTPFYQRGGQAEATEHRRLVETYAEAGGNVIDSASAYGDSEEVLGEILEGQRDRFVVTTKYTLSRDPKDLNAAGNHRKNLMLSLEQSLRRLRTDYIDLYWVHIWDRHTPLEETMRALDDAVRSGKILYVGISDSPAWVVSRANTLAEWRGWTPFAGVQVPYNLLHRDIERELLPMAEALGVSVATWRPLAQGVLGGSSGSRLSEREQAAVRAVQEVAGEVGATAAQVAIAWTRARSRAVHPIIAASSAAQLKENLGAAELSLPGEAVERLDSAVEFDAGFLANFIAECDDDAGVFGEDAARVDGRRTPIP